MSYTTPFPAWFAIYGAAGSNWWDAPHQRWYRLRLGSDSRGTEAQRKASFMCYLWAWELPWTRETRRVPLEIPLFHAQLVPPDEGAGVLWVIGSDAAGRDISLPVWEATAGAVKLLDLDELPFPVMTAEAHAALPALPPVVRDELWRKRAKGRP